MLKPSNDVHANHSSSNVQTGSHLLTFALSTKGPVQTPLGLHHTYGPDMPVGQSQSEDEVPFDFATRIGPPPG
ncbi:hypothetical protein DL764_003406 [Monosporascus ibericus]|uniref:Uncharacterized protein n=1 Tax=Monosporascus ibericus TaxID=155417 RepID=A0A4Q4TL96_9PEZI|nr:hypothetical protein DL764_003406 [Monosporascus ibericus]